MKYTALLGCYLLASISAIAQISGRVYSVENGSQSPIPLATVHWEGTDVRTITDSEGYYTIEKPSNSTILMVHKIGYSMVRRSVISRQGTMNFELFIESDELGEVTVQGRARETGIDLSAAQLRLNIDQKELRKAACCNLSESFETNASVDVQFTDAVTGTRQIEMLGLAGKYALIQRENTPFARGLNATSGLTFIPGPFVESIQLTKGLSSVINGYESITGQINVEYFKPEETFNLKVNGFANAGSRLESNVLITTPLTDNLGVGLLAHYSQTPFAQDRNGDGFADMPTGSQLNIHNRWKYNFNENWGGQVGISLIDDQRFGGQLDDILPEGYTGAPWTFEQSNQRVEIHGKTGYISPASADRSLGFVYSISNQSRESSFGSRRLNGNQFSASFNAIYQDILGSANHSIKTGLSYMFDDVDEVLLNDVNAIELNRQESVPGAFLEYVYTDQADWTVVLGSRIDYNNLWGWIFTPRVNVKYTPTETTTIRLGGGRGQRTANILSESYSALASNRLFSTPNNPIQAEIAWNFGLSYTRSFLINGKGSSVSLDGFYTYFDNKLIGDYDLTPQFYSAYYNAGSNSLSALVQWDIEPVSNLNVRLAYKYLRSIDTFVDGPRQSYGVPPHRAFVNVAYEWRESWKFDLTWNWFDSRPLPSSDWLPEELQIAQRSPSFQTVNLQVNKSFNRWDVYVGVDNLFDYRQDNPVTSADDPSSPFFDTNRVYGPIFGRTIYAGFYFDL